MHVSCHVVSMSLYQVIKGLQIHNVQPFASSRQVNDTELIIRTRNNLLFNLKRKGKTVEVILCSYLILKKINKHITHSFNISTNVHHKCIKAENISTNISENRV